MDYHITCPSLLMDRSGISKKTLSEYCNVRGRTVNTRGDFIGRLVNTLASESPDVYIKYVEELQLKKKLQFSQENFDRIFSLRDYQVRIILKNEIPTSPKEHSDRRFHQLQVRPGSNPRPLQVAKALKM